MNDLHKMSMEEIQIEWCYCTHYLQKLTEEINHRGYNIFQNSKVVFTSKTDANDSRAYDIDDYDMV